MKGLLKHATIVVCGAAVLAAYALAYTTAPCQITYPSCDHSKEGAQCGGGTGTIHFGDAIHLGIYYCGGNSSGRCGGTNPPGTCSELLFRPCDMCEVFCGDTSLGWCADSLPGTPQYTGYDCGDNPCDDVPANQRHQPDIVGPTAPCDPQHGTPCSSFQVG